MAAGPNMIPNHGARQRFQKFLSQYHEKKLLVLELGIIGWRNQLIKAPLMRLVAQEPNATYITINLGEVHRLHPLDVVEFRSPHHRSGDTGQQPGQGDLRHGHTPAVRQLRHPGQNGSILVVSRANQEQNDPAARPAITGTLEHPEDYDAMFLGYPIWRGQVPKIIHTFLESYDFDGVTIVPFRASGSSGTGWDGCEAFCSQQLKIRRPWPTSAPCRKGASTGTGQKSQLVFPYCLRGCRSKYPQRAAGS